MLRRKWAPVYASFFVLFLAAGVGLLGQSITIPNTFSNGTIADATQVNANFSALSSNALNRNGGTMLGTLNSRALTPTSDATYDVGTTLLKYRDGWFSRNVAVGGTFGATGAATFSSTITAGGRTYTFPASETANGCLTTNGSGALTWAGCTGTFLASTTSTGTQNDFSTGLTFVAGQVSTLRANNATLLTLNGVSGGVDGAFLRICSVGAGQVDLAHQAGASTATMRLLNFVTSGNTSLAAGVGCALFLYDGTTARWRLTEHEQGAWITPTFAAGDFTANSGTWTVASGNVSAMKYWLKGRDLTFSFYLTGGTSVSATPAQLFIGNGEWGGFTATGNGEAAMWGLPSLAIGAEVDHLFTGTDQGGTTTKLTLRRGQYTGVSWVTVTNEMKAGGTFSIEVN